MAFFDLYYDLADQLNDTADDNLTRTKKWINWTLRDLVSLHDFEEMQREVQTTASSYNFNRVGNISSDSTISFTSDDGTDAVTATVYGYSLASNVRTYRGENVAVNGTATASTTNTFNVIDRIEMAEAAGTVTVSAGSDVIATINPGETRVANDFRKVIKVDRGSEVDPTPIHLRDRLLKFPGDSNFVDAWYSIMGNTMTFYNLGDSTKTIYYQGKHDWLINDYDTSPLFVSESDIVDAAWLGWGLRFEDEAGADNWKVLYKQKLQEIIGTRVLGDDLTPSFKPNRRR